MKGALPLDWRVHLETRFGPALRRFFGRRFQSDQDACDLTNELFVRVLANRSAVQVENPEAYIFAAASNLVREKLRRTVVRGSTVPGAVDVDIMPDLNSDVEDFTPERILLGRDGVERALRTLEGMNETTRAIFILHRVEGIRQKDIALKFGISVSAVEKHIAKALVHLVKARGQ